MNKTLLALLLLSVFLSTTAFASINEIDKCTKLDVDGEYYLLNTSVNSLGTCFIISANNITLDGAGYYINFSNLTAGSGIVNIGYDNIIVKDVNVNQINNSFIYNKAINFNGSNNFLISNVTTSAMRETIHIYSSNNGIIIDSRAISDASAALFIYNSSNITIENSTGTSTTSDISKKFNSRGIQIAASKNNTIINSIGISTNVGEGIDICTCSSNNTIINSTGISNTGNGISITSSSNNSVISSRGISNTGYGLYITLSNYDNNIITNGNYSSIYDESVIKGTQEPLISSGNIVTVLSLILFLLIFIFIIRTKSI